ncbi:hypothetical protein [Streptomyces sp. NPDC004726]
MGIESDQLVYDYLSRVGDLAQQRQLPSGTRMRLVSELRGEIDRQRTRAVSDNPASVRRILGRLGSPDEVVAAATDGGHAAPAPRSAAPDLADPDRADLNRAGFNRADRDRPSGDRQSGDRTSGDRTSGDRPSGGRPVPEPPSGERPSGLFGLPGRRIRRRIPRPRRDSAPVRPEAPPPGPVVGLPPHLAGLDELGPSHDKDVDWWRVEPKPYGAGERVAGFTGGVEIPEILHPPRPEDGSEEGEDGEGEGGEAESEDAGAETGRRRWASRWRPRLRRRGAAAEAEGAEEEAGEGASTGVRLGNPFLLLAAALLIAGVVLGSWLALGLGWLLAYGSRRLTPFETKLTVFGLPAAAVTAGLVWLWGRNEGRWGDPIPQEGMRDALAGTWPWVLKGAAIASALYLVWRARRR